MSLTPFRVGQSKTPFIFSSSILIHSGPITTPKNPISFIFHTHFSGFTYKSFSASLFTTSSTNSLCSFYSTLIITLSIKRATFPVLMRFHKILFIMVWKIAGKFVSSKIITIGLNDPSGVVNAAFYLSPFFICTLL